MSKKIAILINNAYLYAGTENICNFMSEVMGGHNEVQILSLEGSGKPFYEFFKAKEIINFSSCRIPLISCIKYIKKQEFDFVFVITMGKLSVIFSFLSLFYNPFNLFKTNRKIKIFSCEHVSIQSYPSYIRFLKRVFLRYYDDIVVLTDNDRELLFSWGIDATKIVNPISKFDFNRNTRTFNALAIGRLSYQKGFDRLLFIWKEFIKNNAHWHLKIAGDGEEKERLLALVDQLSLRESVTFLGKVEDVSNLYRDSDMYLMTSRYEGLPLVLLEAISWHLPVIAYSCPTGPKEIIIHGENGYLINDDNYSEFLKHMNIIANNDSEFYKQAMSYHVEGSEYFIDNVKEHWVKFLLKH